MGAYVDRLNLLRSREEYRFQVLSRKFLTLLGICNTQHDQVNLGKNNKQNKRVTHTLK
jgi:hypothetical protein